MLTCSAHPTTGRGIFNHRIVVNKIVVKFQSNSSDFTIRASFGTKGASCRTIRASFKVYPLGHSVSLPRIAFFVVLGLASLAELSRLFQDNTSMSKRSKAKRVGK